MRAISFKSRARTFDHLGQEQIADTQTAMNEQGFRKCVNA